MVYSLLAQNLKGGSTNSKEFKFPTA